MANARTGNIDHTNTIFFIKKKNNLGSETCKQFNISRNSLKGKLKEAHNSFFFKKTNHK